MFPARKDGQNHFATFGHNGQPFCDVTGSQYDYPTSSGSSFMLRSCGFEPVPNPRTQVLMIEHLFATRLEASKVIALQGLELVGQVPFDPSAVLNN